MLGLSIVLLASAALAHGVAPPYVQSREAFTHAKTYLSEALNPKTQDIYDAESRRHFAYGILADAIAALVTADRKADDYNALLVINKEVPYAWRNYKTIAMQGQALLNEASAKVRLIEDLIDNLCGEDSVPQCNAKVQAKVVGNQYAYKLPAELLLLLGKVSVAIRRIESTLNSVTQERSEIPYLINNVETTQTKALVQDLENVYKKLRQLQFRRFLGDDTNINIIHT